jgi:putative membrane protein
MMNTTTSLRAIALVVLPALAFIRCGGEQKVAEAPSDMPSAEPPADQAPELDAGTAAQTPQGIDIATSTEGTKPPAPKAESLNDAQIAAITEAANSAEIAQAKIAQAKSKDAAVKTFAAMMITHHGEAKQKQAKLKLKTEESGVSTALTADAGATLNALNSGSGTEFDKVYIAAQIAGHQKVLDTINDKLLPNVKDERLKAYLEEIKPTVEQHLKQAKQLQESFDSRNTSTPQKDKHAG